MNTDKKWVDHIIKEGVVCHVLWWDCYGTHCSKSNCIINKDVDKRKANPDYSNRTSTLENCYYEYKDGVK